MTWQTVKLEEIAITSSGGTPKRDVKSYYGGEINWVKSGELAQDLVLSSEEFITEEGLKNSSAKVMPPGTVLLAMYGATVGAVSILGIHAATNQAVCCIQPSDTLDVKYLRSYLKSIKPTLVANRVGGAQPNLSQDLIRRLKIPLPPLPEQKRIAAILDKADELKRKREAAIAKLDQLAQSVFVEMFGDVESNDKRHPIKYLKDVCLRITDGTHQAPKWENDGVPFLFISNIVNGEILLATNKYISDETYNDLTKRCPIEIGDVLYTTVGSYGNVAIVKTTEKFCFQRHIAHIKPNRNLVNAAFISAMLYSKSVRQQVDKVARGVAQKTVNLSDLSKLSIFLPPFALQEEFAKRIEKVERLIIANTVAYSTQINLFASLQHKAFSGQL